MTKTRITKSIVAAALAALMCLSVVGCTPKTPAAATYTFRDYTTVSPSNWNELTYQDNNDTQIMSYLGSSFYSYDFKFDENGKPVPGEFVMKYEAATKLEDVSGSVDAKWGVPAGGKGYAYKITLREDLKWNDGTPIKAEDFVYTMKQQLDPLFQNYRADSFYAGATIIVNAQNYLKQGSKSWEPSKGVFPVYSENLDSQLIFAMAPNEKVDSYFRTSVGFPASYDLEKTVAYMQANWGFTGTAADMAKLEGKTLAEIKADASLKAIWENLITFWQTEPNEELDFFITDYTFPTVDFSEVGIFVGETDYELILVLAKPLTLLKENGDLSYQAAYNMASLPLVKKDLYESCKIEPSEATTLWTTNYHTSVATTASWGPYMLTSFQAGKQYTLERNENWYGYALPENEGLYQTDKIVCDTVKEWATAWQMFQAGQIDGIGIDVTIADDYKGSSRAYFTPSDYVGSLQLQSNKEALKAREEEGINKTLFTYQDFRKALSLAINRADYATKCTTSHLAGFGLFNSMHYYDVENGGVYRNSDEAKKVLCEVYAVDYTKFANLDEAVKSITGYNVEEARKLVTKAYQEALAAGDIKATDKFKVTFGTAEVTEVFTRRVKFIVDAWTELFKGTPLEGRLEYEEKGFSDAWANDFRAGAYDVTLGGWTGAAWDPGWFLTAYLSDQYRYAKGWDPTATDYEFTMKGVGENGADVTASMNLIEWYDCLNGNDGAAHDWSANALDHSQRLQLIAFLEQKVLETYYTLPITYEFGASLLSYKVDYITYEYNTFMSYGGIKYMTYNFNDAQWEAEVAKYDGVLDYKK